MTRILIVEDNDLNRDMLSRRLERRGFEIATAVDGKQGLRMAETVSPDLILLDLSLPEMDGWQVLQHLKSDPKLKRVPVIALTAHALSSDRDRALGAGFDEYDIKPVELPRLLKKVDALLTQEKAS